MTGFEIAGLVLGAPPLIFYALDNYKRILKPFTRYGKFESCLETLESLISVERALFANEVRLLLSTVFSRDEAAGMTAAPHHPLWQDIDAENQLKSHLDTSYDIVVSIIREIADILQPLLDKVTSLSRLASEDAEAHATKKASKRRVAKYLKERLKFSVQERHFEDELSACRTRVQTLTTFLQQHDRMEATEKLYSGNRSKKLGKARDLKAFLVIRESSRTLFQVVQRSCTRHESHSAHFGLLPRVEDAKLAQVWFDLVFGRAAKDPLATVTDLGIRLLVESCLKSKLTGAENSALHLTTVSSTSSAAQPNDLALISSVFSSEPRKKKVKFADDGPGLGDFVLNPNLQLPDFMLRHDFCQWLSRNLTGVASQQNHCIGCFDCNARHQLRFHVQKEEKLATLPQKSVVSLHVLLQKMSTERMKNRVPLHEKFRFARILASAVLSFHDTPWLISEDLCSTKIFFCNYAMEGEDFYDKPLPDPYITVPMAASGQARLPSGSSHTFIKNLLVFRLGIMLLELAFEEPLEKLQVPSERDMTQTPVLDSQRVTADRLITIVRHQTCKGYEDVVRKCIRRYASDSPLEQSEDVRREYYSDIVSELQNLEDTFRKLNTGEDDDD